MIYLIFSTVTCMVSNKKTQSTHRRWYAIE